MNRQDLELGSIKFPKPGRGLSCPPRWYHRGRLQNGFLWMVAVGWLGWLSVLHGAELIAMDSTWRCYKGYDEATSPDPTAWRQASFGDTGWQLLSAPFWYGDPQPAPGTFLADMRNNYRCVFLRQTFTLDNPARFSSLTLNAYSDDGFVAWINGREVARFNMPEGEPTFVTDSLPALPEPIPMQIFESNDPREYLVAGVNVLAIQAHNSSLSGSSDFVLNVSLAGIEDTEAPFVETLLPPMGAEVRGLDSIEVLFSEPVKGVNASDLVVNGQPATNVTVFTDRQYVFSFPRPGAGSVSVAWAVNAGITDLAATPHPFGGGSWSYVVNPNLAPPGVLLSEIMADNDRTTRDEDGDSSDWIELRNAGTTAVNLGGWFLTQDTNHVDVWRFPNVTLSAGGYRVVFASGKNRANAGGTLHTHFKLPKGGGYLALLDAGRTVVSEFRFYPSQFTDVSYGRDLVAPSLLGYFPSPTPGTPNSTSGAGFAPEVSFSRPGGTFSVPFALTLSTRSSEAEIRYTTNGSVPTGGSALYGDPLQVTNSVLIRARAFRANLFPGPVQSEGYIRLGASVLNANSDLPYVILHNFGTGTFPAGNPDKPAFVAVFEPRANGVSSLTNAADFTSRVGANVRGSSTEGYPKTSYAVEMWAETDEDHNKPLLGMPSESDWVFYAPNSFEPVLIHNPFAHALSREIGRYSPRTRFAEVYVNTTSTPLSSGHYMGIYAIEEKVKRSPNRVDIDRLEPEHTAPPAVTGGYLIKIDRSDPDERTFWAAAQGLVYQDPSGPEIQDLPQRQPQEDFLSSFLDTFYNKLYAADWTNAVTGYAAYLDVDAAIDHSLLNVVTFNVDALRLSGYMHIPRNGKLTFGPLWDFDRALGSTDGRDQNPRIWRSAVPDFGTDFFNYPWWDRLFQDPDFWQRYVDRYQGLRAGAFATTNLHALVDRYANEVRKAQLREVNRWPGHAPRGGSYQAEINLMKNWLSNRVDFMDTNFLSRPRLSLAGGPVVSGSQVTLTPAAKTGSYVVYTLNGIDPRQPGGIVMPGARSNLGPVTLTLSANTHVVARSFNPAHNNLTGPSKPPLSTPWSGSVTASYVVTTPKLVITEIMFHPPPPQGGETNDAEAFEYLEIRNLEPAPFNLRGVRVGGGVEYLFTANLLLAPGQRIVLTGNPTALISRYGTGFLLAPGAWTGRLGNDGDRLVLTGPLGEPILDFRFKDGWHPLSDGPGFSLVAVDEQASPAAWSTAAQWRLSGVARGTPGLAETALPTFPSVVVNEALTHTDPPQIDTIELFNAGPTPANIGGWLLTDDFDAPLKFRIPSGTVLEPGQFLTFAEPAFSSGISPFLLSSLGDQVWLFSADPATTNLTGYLDGFEFGAARNGVAFGRHLDTLGRAHFVAQAANTLGSPNTLPRISPVVINELMIQPPPVFGTNNNTRDEFVELYNRTDQPVPLFDPASPTNTWKLDGAVSFTMPEGLTIPPGGHLVVVGFDPTWSVVDWDAFRANYSLGPGVLVVGPFDGHLDNAGESVRLFQPDPPQQGGPDDGFVPYVLVESVRYDVIAPWPTNLLATGQSLQRSDAEAFADDPAHWHAGAATPGALNTSPPGLPPRITAITLASPDTVTITWRSEPGRTYRLEFKSDLDESGWSLAGTYLASGPTTSATNVTAGAPRRYYRIQR